MMTPEALADQLDALSRQVASLQSRFAAQDQAALEVALSPADVLRVGAYPSGADVYPAGTTTPGAENILADGSVTVDTIAARAVNTEKLSVGVPLGANLLADPGFEEGSVWSGSRTTSGVRTGTYAGVMVTSATEYLTSARFPVMPSRRYLVSGWGRGHSGNTTNFQKGVGITFYDAAQAYISNTDLDLTATGQSNTYSRHTGVVAAPSNAAFATVYGVHYGTASTQAWTYWDDFECYTSDNDVSAAGGDVLIVDGGMTVKNGKFTIEDLYGSTTMTASGFAGTWSQFIATALYNSNFVAGATGTLAVGHTSDLPYWTITKSVGNPTVSRNVNTSFGSGYAVKCLFTAVNDDLLLLSDKVPVVPGLTYGVGAVMRAVVNAASATVVNATTRWYNAAGTEISSETNPIYSVSGPYGIQFQSTLGGHTAPVGAASMAVEISLNLWVSYTSGDYLEIGSIVVTVAPLALHDGPDSWYFTNHLDVADRLKAGSLFHMEQANPAVALTANQTSWAIGSHSVVVADPDAARTIHGIKHANPAQILLLFNADTAFSITLAHMSASADYTDERIACPNGASLVIRPTGGVHLWYDADIGACWRVVGP